MYKQHRIWAECSLASPEVVHTCSKQGLRAHTRASYSCSLESLSSWVSFPKLRYLWQKMEWKCLIELIHYRCNDINVINNRIPRRNQEAENIRTLGRKSDFIEGSLLLAEVTWTFHPLHNEWQDRCQKWHLTFLPWRCNNWNYKEQKQRQAKIERQ